MEQKIEKSTKVKRSQNKPYVPKIINRRCKILDSYITEYMPEGGYVQYLTVIFSDIDDSSMLTLNASHDELNTMGISLDTKGMIDLCSWLKTHKGIISISIDEFSHEITIDKLLNSIPQSDNDGSQGADNHDDIDVALDLELENAAISKNIKAKKKFGK